MNFYASHPSIHPVEEPMKCISLHEMKSLIITLINLNSVHPRTLLRYCLILLMHACASQQDQ